MEVNMVQLVNLVKSFENYNAVDNINIEIKKGEFLTLLGPSGCGKTTTLRMIAGFEVPTAGKILLEDEEVSNKPAYERDVNTVFQSYALFPHLNIFDNISFSLKIKKYSKKEIKEKVMNVLKLVRLEGYENRKPSQLSGGQKQRVAIARAVVNNPKVLLLDEPLGALDLKLRKEMQFELKHLQKKLGITFIYVTHDQEEALTMSDRIAVMNQGKIEQIDIPSEIYERPKTKFVANFIGEANIFEGTVINANCKEISLKIETGPVIKVKNHFSTDQCIKLNDKVFVTIRPEKMKLSYTEPKNRNTLFGEVKERIYVGSLNRTIITLKSGKEITINEPTDNTLHLNEEHDEVFISWEYQHGVVIL